MSSNVLHIYNEIITKDDRKSFGNGTESIMQVIDKGMSLPGTRTRILDPAESKNLIILIMITMTMMMIILDMAGMLWDVDGAGMNGGGKEDGEA
ncbi:unnamed protein product [Camellia sinensis]